MSALATRIEKEAGRPLTSLEIFDITALERSLSRLLMLYISTGLLFMVLPVLAAASIGIWTVSVTNAHGIWGASHDALPVGLLAIIVFAVAQLVLPVFSGMRMLFIQHQVHVPGDASSHGGMPAARQLTYRETI